MDQYLPLLRGVMARSLTWALGPVFLWLLERGILHDGEQAELVGAVSVGLLALGALIWQEVRKLRTVNTAVAMKDTGATPDDVKVAIANGDFAPAIMSTDQAPVRASTGDGSVDPKRFVGMLILSGLLAASTACSLPLKQRISAAHQGVRGAIVLVDDTERSLCAPAPAPKSNVCTNPAAATVQLTDAKHQEISRALASAYDYDIKAGTSIIAWRPGDPMPASIGELLKVAQEALAVAKTIASSTILDQAEALTVKARALYELFFKQ